MPIDIVSVDNKELEDEIQYRIDRLQALRLQIEGGQVSLVVNPAHGASNTLPKVQDAIDRLTEARDAVKKLCGWQGMFCKFEVQ